jgi:hypothetical protein
MLECHDIRNIVSFYEKHDFKVLRMDESDRYLQMIRKLK